MTDSNPPSRRKRFARRAVMALAGVVLLVASYVLGCGGYAYYTGRLGPTAEKAGLFLYGPMGTYIRNDCPGARFLETYIQWCRSQSTESPKTWNEIEEIVDNSRRIRAEWRRP